jgi:hypothetical protein
MRKAVIAAVVLLLLILMYTAPALPRASARPVCPRGYYLVPGPNSFGGNPRVCMPIGEANSEDAIPAVNYMPPLDSNVIQSL